MFTLHEFYLLFIKLTAFSIQKYLSMTLYCFLSIKLFSAIKSPRALIVDTKAVIYYTYLTLFLALLSFSDQNFSVVRRRCRCCRCSCCRCRRRRCRKLFNNTSPEPLGQFQTNLAKRILG